MLSHMNMLLIEFRNNDTAHDDVHLWIEGYSCTADSYFFALDRELLDRDESPDKVRFVLIRLLQHWMEALAWATETRPAYLPFDFSDQYTGCLRCRPDGDSFEIVPGFSDREGWSFSPSDPGDYLFGITDFRSDGPTSIRLAKEELLRRIQESIACAESVIGSV